MQGLTRTIEKSVFEESAHSAPDWDCGKTQVSHDRIRGPWATSGLLKKVEFRRTVQFASLSQTPISTTVPRWRHAGGNGGKMLLRILGESRYRHTSHTTGTAPSALLTTVHAIISPATRRKADHPRAKELVGTGRFMLCEPLELRRRRLLADIT